ncbi:hypothetical protein H0H81_000233 [Sphagnurus paluster]|uniref:Uncharacterized protein n=1 Tax=Sphagnurus paluster TaxID=117069 RepID=A0A9P7GP74_9AGAR|nr:hypothetical protein H0H81_000233 [Sphagnurus paluster]
MFSQPIHGIYLAESHPVTLETFYACASLYLIALVVYIATTSVYDMIQESKPRRRRIRKLSRDLSDVEEDILKAQSALETLHDIRKNGFRRWADVREDLEVLTAHLGLGFHEGFDKRLAILKSNAALVDEKLLKQIAFVEIKVRELTVGRPQA